MEVDLTEDDVVTAPAQTVVTVDITDDDDIVPPSRQNRGVSRMQGGEVSRDNRNKLTSTKISQTKNSGKVDKIVIDDDDDKIIIDDDDDDDDGSSSKIIIDDDDDDDVIEVVDPSVKAPLQQKKSTFKSKEVASSKPERNKNFISSLSKSKTLTKRMETDKAPDIVAVTNSTKGISIDPKGIQKSTFPAPIAAPAKQAATSTARLSTKPPSEKMEVDDVIEIRNSDTEVSSKDNSEKHTFAKPREKPDVGHQRVSIDSSRQSNISSSKFVVDITGEQVPKRRIENKCLNARCKSGENLGAAPMMVVSYFGCKLKKGKYEVCAACFSEVMDHHEKLAKMLARREPLLAYKDFPSNDITVVDLESDEDTSEPEDPLPYSFLQDVENNLEKVILESLSKYDLDFQVKEASEILSVKMDALEMEAKAIDKSYDELQKDIDSLRFRVYKDHDPIRREVESIDFPCDFHHPQPSTLSVPWANLEAYRDGITGPPRGVAMKKVTHMSPFKSPPSRLEGPGQEVVALEQIRHDAAQLPPIGPLTRPRPRNGDIVYVMKMSFFGVWLRGRVVEVLNNNPSAPPLMQTLYKVKMEIQGNKKQFSIKTVSGRHMAYPNPAPVRLPVGTRVIAVFQEDESSNKNKGGSYYSGLIAEPPKSNNRYRYLVFFDDGYAQYVTHNKILVVCDSSRNVWDDIHPDSRDFIRKYLDKYPERPMVKLAPNQVVKTEWNGKWWIARVIEVDGSLVKMSFDADKRTEWIYRGSTRLAPLFTELAQQQARQQARQESGGTLIRMRGLGMRKINQPYVEYTQNIGVEDEVGDQNVAVPTATVRAVAKKSTSKRSESNIVPIQSVRPEYYNPDNIGIVKELQLPKDAPMPKRYQMHNCGPKCIEWIKYDPEKMRGYNPLSIPLYCGWQRELPKFKKKTTIMYTAPCGRRLRNMGDLHKYLRICRSNMSVDLFDFDFWVNALSEFTLSDKVKVYIRSADISYGKENVPIPLVNYVDHSVPGNLMYATQRKPYEGVRLNTDPEFLCGCDCTDDCQNKEKCACQQLTIQGSSLYPGGAADPSVGYYYRRLQERVITGIYECNQQCKCSKTTCLNRVVQHPLQLKLQLFKTPNKGWGLRCINDIPKGTFICIYAGYLYTEQTANYIGEQDGDDYLAELDYIEVVERMKEDYESDVEDEPLEEEEEGGEKTRKSSRTNESGDKRVGRNRNKDEADSDFKAGWKSLSENSSDDTIRSRLRKRTSADLDLGDGDRSGKRKDTSQMEENDMEDESDDDKQERQPSSFTPKPLRKPGNPADGQTHRFQSVRKFYGPNEQVYIMDANKVGNIGRYLNHSCSPNVFVQNVFVDTHDLRFPWVAFFALTYIRAGTELTWDYNYDVGSVPDKVIKCQCGTADCRGRLL